MLDHPSTEKYIDCRINKSLALDGLKKTASVERERFIAEAVERLTKCVEDSHSNAMTQVHVVKALAEASIESEGIKRHHDIVRIWKEINELHRIANSIKTCMIEEGRRDKTRKAIDRVRAAFGSRRQRLKDGLKRLFRASNNREVEP